MKLRLVWSQPDECVQRDHEMRFWTAPLVLIILGILVFDSVILYYAVKGITQ